MTKKTTQRVSLSLPKEQLIQLDRLSEALGVSRTSVVSALLSRSLPDAVLLLDSMSFPPAENSETGARRAAYDLVEKVLNSGDLNGSDSLQ